VICNSWVTASVDIGNEGEATVITVQGEIDLRSAPQFQQCLLEIARRTDKPLVVDLTKTSFLDCRGLATLAATRDALQAHGQMLYLHGAQGIVRRILALSDLVDLLEEPPVEGER
jgi:anti-sigma B factor antagonist